MLRELHAELGIPEDYDRDGARPIFAEATELVDVGPNLVGRMQRLTPATAEKWAEMQAAAAAEGITLLLVSGFRSVDYQARLIRKKLNAGQSLSDILAVNAAPGHSEHQFNITGLVANRSGMHNHRRLPAVRIFNGGPGALTGLLRKCLG